MNKDQLIKTLYDRKEIMPMEDGYNYYCPSKGGGALSPWELKTIANELDRINKAWDDEVSRALNEHRDKAW